jgi:hypothetical protein
MHQMVLYWLWLFYVSCHKDKIILGWQDCGIMRAFDHKFQIEVMGANTIKCLFSSHRGSNIKPFHTSGLDPKNVSYIYLDPDVEECMSSCCVNLPLEDDIVPDLNEISYCQLHYLQEV